MSRSPLGCMVVLTLATRGWLTTTTTAGSRRALTLCRAVNGSKGPKNRLQPSTGWNHNLPKKDSAFWKGTNSDDDNEGAANQGGEASTELRTGWLHNTQSPQQQQAEAELEESVVSGRSSVARQLLEQAMKEKERNHRILCPPAFHACGNDRQVVVTEHKISLPVFRNDTSSSRIDVFFTIVEQAKDSNREWWESLTTLNPTKRAQAYVQKAAMEDANDMILYLQGGPGFGAPTPVVGLGLSSEGSWAGKALSKFSRIVLMDQRGTGRSTPVTKQSLEKQFPNLFLLDDATSDDSSKSIDDLVSSHPDDAPKVSKALTEATEFMAQFRADNIVQDAEEIKDALLLPTEETTPRPYGGCLGQSFGGFCIMTYLSQVDNPPRICLLTGGIGPMSTAAYDLYKSLWERVKERNLKYYEMYPGDIAVVKKIVRVLLEKPAALPSGGLLTARRFLQQGLALGGSPSAFAAIHAKLSTAFLTDDEPEFSKAFLQGMEYDAPFDNHPFYFLLHESIYGDGPGFSPTQWAAHRAYEDLVKTPSEFDYKLTSTMDSDARPTLFFGEMVFPWMADGDYVELSGLGMKSLAHALAQKDDWGPLYDANRMSQALGSVTRAAAAVYVDDMYVDFDACRKLTQRGGPLDKCKLWITNEYQHSGLRDNGAEIFSKLYSMATGSTRTPS